MKLIKDMRQRVLDAVVASEKQEPRYPLSPSQATKSLRDLYYSLVNYHKPGTIPVDPLDGQTLLKFKLGYLIEEHIKDYVAKVYTVKDAQARVTMSNGKFSIGGNIDWAIEVDGETILMDSKSSAAYPFNYKVPKEDNMVQMQLYMHSDWGRNNNVNTAILLYYNKDNSDLKFCAVTYDPKVAIEALERLETAQQYYEDGIVPPREYVLGVNWQAAYSMFKTYDNEEFTVPLKDREVVEGPDEELDLAQHVLRYGNKVLDYNGKKRYVKKQGDKLTLKTEGEREWQEI